MAGGTPTHSRLAAAVITSLSVALADRPCAVFSSDLRVRVEATELSTYPDISVVCGTLRGAEIDAQAVTNPIVIVEILARVRPGYFPPLPKSGSSNNPRARCQSSSDSLGYASNIRSRSPAVGASTHAGLSATKI